MHSRPVDAAELSDREGPKFPEGVAALTELHARLLRARDQSAAAIAAAICSRAFKRSGDTRYAASSSLAFPRLGDQGYDIATLGGSKWSFSATVLLSRNARVVILFPSHEEGNPCKIAFFLPAGVVEKDLEVVLAPMVAAAEAMLAEPMPEDNESAAT